MKQKVRILNPRDGFNITANYYANREKYWDSFEKDGVLSILGNVKDKKILDVGAGTGRLVVRLAKVGAEATALDISEVMLTKIKQKLNRNLTKIKTVVGEAENLPFADENFDIIIATFLIVHLKDPSRFFEEAYRVLKPNGLFLVTNINQKKPPEIETKDGKIKIESYYHRPEKIREMLEDLTFGVEKEEFVKEGEVWVNQILLCRK